MTDSIGLRIERLNKVKVFIKGEASDIDEHMATQIIAAYLIFPLLRGGTASVGTKDNGSACVVVYDDSPAYRVAGKTAIDPSWVFPKTNKEKGESRRNALYCLSKMNLSYYREVFKKIKRSRVEDIWVVAIDLYLAMIRVEAVLISAQLSAIEKLSH